MRSLDHFAFQVADLDVSIDFYVRVLGLDLMFRENDEAHHEAFAFLELEGGNLELLQSLDEDNKPIPVPPRTIAPPYCPHVAFKTDNLDAVAGQMKRHKVAIVKGPLEIPDRVRWLYVADPDGNVVEFVQWL